MHLLSLNKITNNIKKSQFYKETRISLSDLYKLYYQYMNSQYGLVEKINEALESIDEELLIEKIKKYS